MNSLARCSQSLILKESVPVGSAVKQKDTGPDLCAQLSGEWEGG